MNHPELVANAEQIPRMPVERVQPGEEAAIAEMIDALKQQLTERYAKPPMLRDAHPKHHGLVKATFTVDPDRPPELRHGLFKDADRFEALIRYSNGQPVVGHDLVGDIRGMAIHLTTDRQSLLGDKAHDFILATGEAFFGTNVTDYQGFPAASVSRLKTAAYFLSGFHRLRCGWQLLKAFKRPSSPLVAEYFSQTPYRLGPHCVKHLVRPAPDRSTRYYPWYLLPLVRQSLGLTATVVGWFSSKAVRRIPGFNAMRTALEIDLCGKAVALEFLIQRWPDLSTIPEWAIEDASRVWDLPWTRVATIVVHQQQDIASRDRDAEHMNFNVWRAIEEHQPLGGINRARRAVYLAMSKFRNEFNGVKWPWVAVASPADRPAPSSTAASRA